MSDLVTALQTRDQRKGVAGRILIGQVTAAAGTRVTVDLEGSLVTMPRLRSYTSPAVDDVVLVARAGHGLYCLGALNAAPVPAPPPDPADTPPPAPSILTRTFRPTYTGSYLIPDGGFGSWESGNVRQGDRGGKRRQGAAYYGTGPGSLTGTAVSGTVRILRTTDGSDAARVAATIRLRPEKTRPGGPPDSLATMTGPSLRVGETAVVTLPVGWVQLLIEGDAGGIGCGINTADPNCSLAGKSAWGPALELTIRYRS